MVSFAILFFFAVTGITLNHTEWFDKRERTVQVKGAMPVKCGEAKLETVEFLRSKHSVKGALSDYRIEESQCSVSFKGPGYTADTFIDRATGKYDLTETRMGFIAVINDLHKGRDSGKVWSGIIDISAVLMTLVSLTGMWMLWFLHKRRVSGYVIAVVGAVVSYLVYAGWVP